MAEYELPPLRIKIVGDGKSWERTTEQTIKQAKQLATSLEKIGSSVKASIVNKSVRQAVSAIHATIAKHITGAANSMKIAKGLGTQGVRKAMRDAVGNILTHVSLHIEQVASLTSRLKLGGGTQVNKTMREATRLILHYILIGIRRMVVSAHSVRTAGSAVINRTMRDANKLILHYILINIRRLVASAHSVKPAGSGVVNKVLRQALDVILHSLITRIRMMAVTAHTVRGNAAPLRREVRNGIGTIISYIITAVRSTIVQALSGISIKQFVNNLKKGLQSGLNSASWNPSYTGKGGRGRSGFGALGDRADIYMHMSAIQSLAGAWREPIKNLSEYQTNLASLAPLLGGQDKARSFVDSNRTSMVGQIYGGEALTGAVRFLGANVSLSDTQDALKSIGDIAGGSAERFQGLARAFSQVAAQGNLQGDELEQLAEQNFPLLQLMSQRTGLALDVLRDKMAKRQISSKAVLALLKMETAEGGKYAGVLEQMSKQLPGAISRVSALYGILQTKVMEAASEELARYVNMLAQVLQKTITWVQENPKAVKEYVLLALRVSACVAAFHLLGFAVALVHWQLYTLKRIVGAVAFTFVVLRKIILGSVAVVGFLRTAMNLLSMAYWRTATAATAAWVAALLPVIGIKGLIVGVVALGAAIQTAFAALIMYLVNPNGFKGAISTVWSYMSAFFGWMYDAIYELGSLLGGYFSEALKGAFGSSEEWLKSMGITGDIALGEGVGKYDGPDIKSLLGDGGGAGAIVRFGGVDALSVRQVAENESRLAAYRTQMSSPASTAANTNEEKIVSNTAKTNDLLGKMVTRMYEIGTMTEALQ